MIYEELTATFRSVVNEMGYFFDEGRRSELNLKDDEGDDWLFWLLPFTSNEKLPINQSFTRTFNIVMVIYKQISTDATQSQMREYINIADQLGRDFVRILDESERIQLGDVTTTPNHKELDRSHTGVALTFSVVVPDNYEYCA